MVRKRPSTGSSNGASAEPYQNGAADEESRRRRQSNYFGIALTVFFYSGLVGYLAAVGLIDLSPSLKLLEEQKSQLFARTTYETDDFITDEPGMPCRYDGHCPIGTICGVPGREASRSTTDKDNDLPGVCQGFPVNASRAPSECLAACSAELELDEHFYHESFPTIHDHYATRADSFAPKGCVLRYTSKPEPPNDPRWKELYSHDNEPRKHPSDPVRSIVTWTETRFRHLKRVDPIVTRTSSSSASQMRQAFCTAPCVSDADCEVGSSFAHDKSLPPYKCRKGACMRNKSYWDTSKHNNDKAEMVLVSAADETYFDGLQNLVASARYWAPRHRFVVYNLGLTEEQIADTKSWPNVEALEWEKGIPERYPQHVNDLKVYAWKPLILQETLKKYKMIFWLDAGSTLTGPVTPVENILKENGLFLVKGQDLNMTQWAHPETYKWFGFDKETMKTGPSFSGNTQAYLYPSRFVKSIINKQAACALDESCISPTDSELSNHRYDQTGLSICSYNPLVRAPHHTEFLAATMDQLRSSLSNPSFRIIWTARRACKHYFELMSSNTAKSYWQLLLDKKASNA